MKLVEIVRAKRVENLGFIRWTFSVWGKWKCLEFEKVEIWKQQIENEHVKIGKLEV